MHCYAVSQQLRQPADSESADSTYLTAEVSMALDEMDPVFGGSLAHDGADTLATAWIAYDLGFFFYWASELGGSGPWNGGPLLRPKIGLAWHSRDAGGPCVLVGFEVGITLCLGRNSHGRHLLSVMHEWTAESDGSSTAGWGVRYYRVMD